MLKDHYKTLGIPVNASIQEVKKAYRTLAHQYHPDKNQGNPYSESYFREIQEAYEVLSDVKHRKFYDEERYFAGLMAQKEPIAINGNWILKQLDLLNIHLRKIDSYSINHQILSNYILLLISESHLGILFQEKDPGLTAQITEGILLAAEKLHFKYLGKIEERLKKLTAGNIGLEEKIRVFYLKRKQKNLLDKLIPWIALLITLILCLFMYFYAKK